MAYFSEKVAILKDFSTIKAADISTVGAIANLDTTGFSFVRLTAATELTSLLAQGSGKQLIIVNASASPLVIKNLTGTAGNQINTGNGADLSLPAGSTISFIYDETGAVWVRDQYVPVVASAADTVLQGGNSFGTDFIVGSNDNFNAIVEANGSEVLRARPATAADADVKVTGTGGVELPIGTTAQRPSSPVNGTVRVNTTTQAFEVYVNGAWNTVPGNTTITQGGNSFGADVTIGSNDNFNTILEANGAEVVRARPAAAANADVKVTGTAGVELPIGTTAERPSSPVNGTVRVNTTTQNLEVYVNGVWNTVPGNTTIVQGGNSFGADVTIGANDNFNTIIEANGAEVIRARPPSAANADVKVTGISGLEIPVGTTAQRPSSPTTGTLRLNSTIPALEGYYNSTWNQIGTSTVVSPILGLQTTTAIPAGFIGQQIIDFKATGTTFFVGSGSEGSALFLTLSAGLWEIAYTFQIETSAGAYSNFRLLTWLGATATGFTDAFIENGLSDTIFTPIPTIYTNTCAPIRVAYDGATLTMPNGVTNATGFVYMKALSATFAGIPTYGCYVRAVRVQ